MTKYILPIESIHGLDDYDIKEGGILKLNNSENDVPVSKRVKVIKILSIKITDQVTDVKLLVEDVEPITTFLDDTDADRNHKKSGSIFNNRNNYIPYNALSDLAQASKFFSDISVTRTYDKEGNFISETVHQ